MSTIPSPTDVSPWKILILGLSGAGKTALVQRYVKNIAYMFKYACEKDFVPNNIHYVLYIYMYVCIYVYLICIIFITYVIDSM